MSNEFWLTQPYAKAKRLKEWVTEPGLRAYSESPDTTLLQVRVPAKNGAPGAGTVASVHLTAVELRDLRTFIDLEITRIENRTRIVVARSPREIARERGTV